MSKTIHERQESLARAMRLDYRREKTVPLRTAKQRAGLFEKRNPSGQWNGSRAVVGDVDAEFRSRQRVIQFASPPNQQSDVDLMGKTR